MKLRMRREAWLVLGMLLVVVVLAGAIVYSMYLFQQRQQAAQAETATTTAESTDAMPGEQRYARSCAACHGVDGTGRRGSFPPLAGHMPDLVARDGGREYIIDVLLYGLSGPIEIDGVAYRGFMAPVSRLDDREIADVLNHSLHAWGNDEQLPADFESIRADEVAQRRGRQMGPADVHEARAALFDED